MVSFIYWGGMMKTRMEKYYRADSTSNKRSIRNAELYRTIYDMGEYSNIEGIVSIEKKDEIDLAKIHELLKQGEDDKQSKRHQVIKDIEPEKKSNNSFVDNEEKKYDIREVLNQARDNRPEVDNDYRSLDSTQYNILKKIKLDKDEKCKDYFDSEEGLLELIHTITNTSMLNKLGDKELSLDLLSSLKSTGDTTIYEDGLMSSEDDSDFKNETIDKSFFTSSLNFKDEDFEELKDINKSLKKNNFLIKALSFLLFVTILSVILYIAYTFFKP